MTAAHSRAARLAYYLIPALFCLAAHWQGLETWFLQDDFAWLSLAGGVHRWSDLASALFEPQAQGTVRVFSDRAFFLILRSIFGIRPLPFHIVVFLTEFANLWLLAAVARRLTGSAIAGFAAAILWAAGVALAAPLYWISAYNEILCAFCALAAFYCLVRYAQTGERKFLYGQWIAFLAGFGVLELMVVYPALAALYTALFARRYFRGTLPLFLPSAVFALVHFLFIPAASSPIYQLVFDSTLAETFGRYLAWGVGPSALGELFGDPWDTAGLAATCALGLALAGFSIWKLRKREWLAAFAIGWFCLFLAPVLPLENHVSVYYLTLPSIGLAILGGWALSAAWQTGRAARLLAMLLAGIYLAGSLACVRGATDQPLLESKRMRELYRTIEWVHARHPDRIILLAGVDSELFEAGLQDHPFRLFGATQVYLAPGSENLHAREDLGGIDPFLIPLEMAANAVAEGKAEVLEVAGGHTSVVTERYDKVLTAEYMASFRCQVDAGDPRFATRLGAGWYREEKGFRWMSKRADVILGGPETPGKVLVAKGYAPAALMKAGPLTLTASLDGERLGTLTIPEAGKLFELRFPLPASAAGKYSVRVELEVNRTFTPPGDVRALGLTFGRLEIK